MTLFVMTILHCVIYTHACASLGFRHDIISHDNIALHELYPRLCVFRFFLLHSWIIVKGGNEEGNTS